MSHVAYDLQLADAMNDLQEQVKVEHVPREKNEQGIENIATWNLPDELFQHLACLYIKYIDIYRKIEECYDQIVHPQKRIYIKKVLESTICRICELKKELVMYNPRQGSMYVHLDQLLFDLKYDPSILEIPVPSYFREDDRIPIDIEFKEKVEKEGAKKKKKKKAKKKKKKKKGDDEKKEKIPPISLDEKTQLMEKLMVTHVGTADPEEEIVQDPFTLDMDIVSAIRLVQKNERGRQGRYRIMLILKQWKQKKQEAEMKRKIREGLIKEQTKESQENEASVFIQKRLRGILARKRVEEVRQDEMVFLGMARKPKTIEEMKNHPIDKMNKTKDERKMKQKNFMEEFHTAKEELKEEIDNNEGLDIREAMLKDRRDWVHEFKSLNASKPPDDLTGFYERFNVETPLSPEEEEAKRLQDEEDAKGKKKKKPEKKKEGKKKKKKGDKDEDEDKQIYKFQPSEVVQRFDDFYQDYNDVWANRDESENHHQRHDVDMAKQEVMPFVEEEYKKEVDDLIKVELENMKLLAGIKSKKKKKKGKKKGKKKKKKGLKLPGFKAIRDIDKKDLLVQLIQNGIVKKLPPQRLKDFIGEFNYLHSMLDDPRNDAPYDPSMALIRQLVTEYIIFPLGSELVRKRFPDNVRSFLFYGPPGTGKTIVVRAIAYETNSVVFDLSPLNIEGKYTNKKEEEKLVASVMVVAKEYQPSIIYIDEAEKVWPAKKKGKKKKKKKADPSNPARIKKALAKWKAKFIDDTTRITIIGCTSEPEGGSKKDFKKFFDKGIYFPFPDYTTRRLMWKTFISDLGGLLRHEFPLSTLAHISAGYSAGSIKKTCEKVLTIYRKKHMKQRPLTLQEFIGPLSLCANTMDDQYEEYKKFTDYYTGDGTRREKEQAKLRGDDDDGDPKNKKKKKKKK